MVELFIHATIALVVLSLWLGYARIVLSFLRELKENTDGP